MKLVELESDSQPDFDLLTNHQENYDLDLAVTLSKSLAPDAEAHILPPVEVQARVTQQLHEFLKEMSKQAFNNE